MADTKLTGNTYVRLGAVILMVAFLFGFVVQETKFRTNLIRDVQELRKDIAKLTLVMENYNLPNKLRNMELRIGVLENRAIPDRFHKAEMRLWILQTEKLNTDWKSAPLQE